MLSSDSTLHRWQQRAIAAAQSGGQVDDAPSAGVMNPIKELPRDYDSYLPPMGLARLILGRTPLKALRVKE